MVSPEVTRAEVLCEDCPFFEGLERDQVRQVLDVGELRDAAAGAFLLREGQSDPFMYVVQSGELAVSKKEGARRLELARLSTGDVVGEISLLNETPAGADVQHVTDGRVWVFSGDDLRALQIEAPELALRLLRNLCKILSKRLERVNSGYLDMLSDIRGLERTVQGPSQQIARMLEALLSYPFYR